MCRHSVFESALFEIRVRHYVLVWHGGNTGYGIWIKAFKQLLAWLQYLCVLAPDKGHI